LGTKQIESGRSATLRRKRNTGKRGLEGGAVKFLVSGNGRGSQPIDERLVEMA
jgi:hypothetical protein